MAFLSSRRRRRWQQAAVAAALVMAHGKDSRPEPAPTGGEASVVHRDAASDAAPSLVELGRAIFEDPKLSEPPGTSCASCHDPERAFSSTNGSSLGGPRGSRPSRFARRNAPSLLYLKYVPKFHFQLQDEDDLQPSPFGGFFWDGRSDAIHDLVRQPLLNPDEMNNRDAGSIAAKIKSAPYAAAFRSAFPAAGDQPEAVVGAVGTALEAFLTSNQMAPFSSRYDAFVKGRGRLTPWELEGMRVFKDPAKGGCLACHRFYDTGRDPALSMFTDYGYDIVGVPGNAQLPKGRRPDLGLCERTDKVTPSHASMYCAAFRTPSLRNVAVRASFMHNGAFSSLRDVVAFYATRATDPKRWYHSGLKFEDVPPQYRGQVNVSSVPYNRREGDVPAMNDAEIDAVVAFLRTLTDAKYEHLTAK